MDPMPDEVFYAYERKVVHIETGAIEALREMYARGAARRADACST